MLIEPGLRTARVAPPSRLSAARRRRRRGSADGGSGRGLADRELRPLRTNQLLGGRAANELAADRYRRPRERLGRPHRGRSAPSIEPRSSTDRSGVVEPVEARREERLDRREARSPRFRRTRAPSRSSPRDRAGCRRRRSGSSRSAPFLTRDELMHELGRLCGVERLSSVVAFSFPPPHPGRFSSSSGRARQSSRIGAPRERSARFSIRSRNVGSPSGRRRRGRPAAVRVPTPRAADGQPMRSPPTSSRSPARRVAR